MTGRRSDFSSGRRPSLLAWAVFAATAFIAAAGPLTPEEALKSFRLESNLVIEPIAAEPLLKSPCAVAWDERGHPNPLLASGIPRLAVGLVVVVPTTRH